ncbi:MAG: hypothetical protein HY509_02100 [Acidobacteria bacterium]|nr:hypothetical protein [Acidobacteriota bacterium]
MLPTLPEGSAVRVRPARAEEIPVGRIAVFRKDRLLVIHRLVWKRRIDGILRCAFKGDNGGAVDRVPGDLVLGVVEGRAPAGAAPEDPPDGWIPWRWDRAGRFYRTAFLIFSPPVRFVEFLTRRPVSLPRGRLRQWLRDGHRGIESVLFRRRESR